MLGYLSHESNIFIYNVNKYDINIECLFRLQDTSP